MKRYTSLRDRLLASSVLFARPIEGRRHHSAWHTGSPYRIMIKGWRNDRGYVKLSFRDRSGRSVSVWAHRAAYVALKGKRLRKGQPIDHVCQRRDCIEPEHLFLTTTRRNARLVHIRRARAAAGQIPVEPYRLVRVESNVLGDDCDAFL